MFLESERLILRDWRDSDSADLYEYAKSELVGPNAGWKPHKDEAESKEILQMFMSHKEAYALVLKAENKVIGSVGLHNRHPDGAPQGLKQGEIGYVLNPNYWGNGYIPEAVRCLLDYAFGELQFDLIWCCHYDFNERSKRVIEKCGFRYQFTKHQTLKLLDNKEVTSLCYCLSREEYLSR